jgi:hypothetical protein
MVQILSVELRTPEDFFIAHSLYRTKREETAKQAAECKAL